MKRYLNNIIAAFAALFPAIASAQTEGVATSQSGLIAIGAAICVGIAAAAGTLAQGKAVSSALDSIGRNPGATGSLFIPLILGLAFIESLVIFAFVISFSLLGKL